MTRPRKKKEKLPFYFYKFNEHFQSEYLTEKQCNYANEIMPVVRIRCRLWDCRTLRRNWKVNRAEVSRNTRLINTN